MKFYLSLFWRRLPWMLLILVLASATGITLARILPPVYVSQATLLVESDQIPDNLAKSTVNTSAIEQLQIIQQRIMTRDKLLELANKLNIYGQPGADPQALDADQKVEDLRKRINIVTTGGDPRKQQATIVTVSFDAPNPQLAAAVANELVTRILNENVAIRTAVAGQTLDFFTAEVDRLEKALSEKGSQILKFQQAHIDSLPDSLDFRRKQQSAAQDQMQRIDGDLASLKDRRANLVALYNKTGQVGASDPTQVQLTPDQRKLQALQDSLNQALAVLSPENPRVKMLQSQVDVMKKQVDGQTVPGDSAASQPLSPYQLQLADLNSQIEALKLKKKQTQETLDALQKTIEATPANAVTLATLQRDNQNLQTQYDQAVAAKAQAQTGQQLETLAKAEKISVVENAVAPTIPTKPHRTLIAVMGIVGGIFLAAGLFLLLEVTNRRIRRPEDLTAKLGIAAFGTIPLIRTRAERMRRGMIVGGAVVVVLIAVPTVLWYVNTYVTPLDLLINQMADKMGLAFLMNAGPKIG